MQTVASPGYAYPGAGPMFANTGYNAANAPVAQQTSQAYPAPPPYSSPSYY